MADSLRQLLIVFLISSFLLGPASQVGVAATLSPEERLELMDQRLKEVSQSLARQREYEASSALTTEEDRSFRERQHGATYHNISSIESAPTWIADKGPGPQWWQGMLRPGFMAQSGSMTGYTDYLVPVVQNDHGMWFFNPKASLTDDHSNEQNLGVGYRYLNYAETLILGGNVFFDTRKSSYGHHLNQVGTGVEFLTKWVDARMNYYHPLTKARRITSEDTYSLGGSGLLRFNGYEEPLQGVDYEVGFLVPWLSNLVETRVYGGGYYYDSKMFKNVEGGRLRVEVMPTPYLTLEMKTDFDRATGTSTSFGGFVTVPFEVGNIFQKKNPFVGWKEMLGVGRGPRELVERMTDRVVRDLDIVRHTGPSVHAEKAEDMIYVDNSNTSGIEDGTLTHPYTTLAAAVGNVRFIRNNGTAKYIYVRQGSGPYTENFVFDDGEVLWGSGYNGGFNGIPTLGYPIIDGNTSDVITLADHNTVMGLHIQNGLDGIYALNHTGGAIIHNEITGNSQHGIDINSSSDGTISGFTISYNTISNNSGKGINIANPLDVGTLSDFTISGNTITDNPMGGIAINNVSPNTLSDFTISSNTISNSLGDGIYIGNSGTASGFTISNNAISDITSGINIFNSGTASDFTISGNIITNDRPFGAGAIAVVNNGTASDFTISGNTITDNLYNGIGIGNMGFFDGDGEGEGVTATLSNFTISGNTITNNAGNGIYITVPGGTEASDITISNNTISDNLNGISIFSGALNTASDFTISNNTISNNSADGINIDAAFGAASDFTISNNIISENAFNGMRFHNFNGIISGFDVSGNTIKNNTQNGIWLDNTFDPSATFDVDLGGGTLLPSGGQNSIYSNGDGTTYFDVRNDSGTNNLKAINNYWGGGALTNVAPAPTSYTVDAAPYLIHDPNQ